MMDVHRFFTISCVYTILRYIHISTMHKCVGCINYAHCTYLFCTYMLNDTQGCRKCLSGAASVHCSSKNFFSTNRAKDGKHFQPSAEVFWGGGSTDSEANSPTTGKRLFGVLELSCFLNEGGGTTCGFWLTRRSDWKYDLHGSRCKEVGRVELLVELVADVEKAGVGNVVQGEIGAGVAAVRKGFLAPNGFADQGALGVDVREEGAKGVNLVCFTGWAAWGEVKGRLKHVKGRGIDQGARAVRVVLKEVFLRRRQGARWKEAWRHIDCRGMTFHDVLRQALPAVKDSCASLASQVPCSVLDQIGLVLALFVADEAHKVRLSHVALNMPVQMAFLCKRFLADFACERSVNNCWGVLFHVSDHWFFILKLFSAKAAEFLSLMSCVTFPMEIQLCRL